MKIFGNIDVANTTAFDYAHNTDIVVMKITSTTPFHLSRSDIIPLVQQVFQRVNKHEQMFNPPSHPKPHLLYKVPLQEQVINLFARHNIEGIFTILASKFSKDSVKQHPPI